MRTRLPLLSIALLLSGAPLLAQSWDDRGPWYVGFGAGLNSISEDGGFEPDEGFALTGCFGYLLGEGKDGRVSLALEAEYYYAENDLDDFPIGFGTTSDTLETSILFANLVGDWYWTDATSMYLGAGVGYADTVELFDADENGSVAYQGKAGMRFQLGGGFSWNIGYRVVATDDIGDANDFENLQHVGEMGVRWEL